MTTNDRSSVATFLGTIAAILIGAFIIMVLAILCFSALVHLLWWVL